MSDYDRGRRSDRLAFDPREPVRSGPAPVTLILSGLVLAALVGGVVFLYRGGIRHKDGAPPVVGQPVNAIKSATLPDANQVPTGLVIDKTDNTNAPVNFAPAPETPVLRGAQTPPPVVVQTSSAQTPVAQTPTVTPKTAVTPQTAVTPKTAATPVATPTPKPVKPITIASLADDAAARSAARSAPAKTSVTPMATPAPGAGWVQIGAFSSPDQADKGWSDIAGLAPAAMKGKGKKVEPLSRDGKELYRTYITGFASHDAAEAFCAKLKAASKPCIVK